MPDPRDFCHLSFVIQAIYDSIGAKDDLADFGIVILWDNTTNFWVLLQEVGLRYQFVGEGLGPAGIVARDEANDIKQIVTGYRDQISVQAMWQAAA